ncbi:MAG: dihydroorotate dehydrogenase electron transfer subunit [Actinomycetota bacterium]
MRAEVLNVRKAGPYQSVTLVAPEIAERARPGQFVSIAVPADRASLLRQPYTISQASRRGGWAGTLEFSVDPRHPDTAWLAGLRAHGTVDAIGPLGTGFSYPAKLTNCLLVAEGLAAAGMYFLAQELRARGKRVDLVIGASTQDDIFKVIEGKRVSSGITIVTEDGSVGEAGTIASALAGAADAFGSQVVYAAGPRGTLRQVAGFCAERSLPAQILVEEAMACGMGLCFTCVVPVLRKDGSGFDHLRACADGPVFNPGRVLWERWCGPDDAETGDEPAADGDSV